MVFVAMGNDCKMRVVDIPPFTWTDAEPYSTQENVVFMKESDSTRTHFGTVYKAKEGLSGHPGGLSVWEPARCFMLIPFPFDDPRGWNVLYGADEPTYPQKANDKKRYIVCVEFNNFGRTDYSLREAIYTGETRKDTWIIRNRRRETEQVIAWMEFPKPPRDGAKILHLDDLPIHKAYGRV